VNFVKKNNNLRMNKDCQIDNTSVFHRCVSGQSKQWRVCVCVYGSIDCDFKVFQKNTFHLLATCLRNTTFNYYLFDGEQNIWKIHLCGLFIGINCTLVIL